MPHLYDECGSIAMRSHGQKLRGQDSRPLLETTLRVTAFHFSTMGHHPEARLSAREILAR